MATYGSQAYQLDYAASERSYQPRRAPRIHEGGGLDERARQGVSSSFAAKIAAVVVLFVTFVAVGSARIMLTSATVATMKETRGIEEQVKQSQDLKRELQVDRAQLAGTDRIERIATQNYGMTYAGTDVIDHMNIGNEEEKSTKALVGAAASATDSADSSDAADVTEDVAQDTDGSDAEVQYTDDTASDEGCDTYGDDSYDDSYDTYGDDSYDDSYDTYGDDSYDDGSGSDYEGYGEDASSSYDQDLDAYSDDATWAYDEGEY